MATRKYFVGQTIGNKLIVSEAEKDIDGHRRYIWRCTKCGVEQGPRTGSKIFFYPDGKCCGKGGIPKKPGSAFELITSKKMSQIKFDAKKRNLVFEIDAEFLWHLWLDQDGKCAYTGLQLTHGLDASLDRKDNLAGYVSGNVQWVHKDINYMKKAYTEEYFIKMCKLVAKIK